MNAKQIIKEYCNIVDIATARDWYVFCAAQTGSAEIAVALANACGSYREAARAIYVDALLDMAYIATRDEMIAQLASGRQATTPTKQDLEIAEGRTENARLHRRIAELEEQEKYLQVELLGDQANKRIAELEAENADLKNALPTCFAHLSRSHYEEPL
jgi:hypothetical protein